MWLASGRGGKREVCFLCRGGLNRSVMEMFIQRAGIASVASELAQVGLAAWCLQDSHFGRPWWRP